MRLGAISHFGMLENNKIFKLSKHLGYMNISLYICRCFSGLFPSQADQ